MIFNCLTIFPDIFTGFLSESLMKKALDKKLLEVNLVDFRDYTEDKHKRVDDYPFGGGAGMLLMAQPLFDCFEAVKRKHPSQRTRNIYMSPSGSLLTQDKVKRLYGGYDVINILCGHYEGVDQRVLDNCIDEEISIGDYVLSGGEVPAMALIDCVARYIPGFLSNGMSLDQESFSDGLLEYPQYTRPQEFRGMSVPDVLVSGHHANICAWQREQSVEKTMRVRPELLESAVLDDKDRDIIQKLKDRQVQKQG
jgi:tRNA (guanine37-N1)-methyltransferase